MTGVCKYTKTMGHAFLRKILDSLRWLVVGFAGECCQASSSPLDVTPDTHQVHERWLDIGLLHVPFLSDGQS